MAKDIKVIFSTTATMMIPVVTYALYSCDRFVLMCALLIIVFSLIDILLED